ncbi:cell division protein [Aquimarina atlantica]|uniref:Cell division protein n=1 Tax=Aquimarina atlantica TaxID=1317122 RepID=A0A023BRJ3_9FLAO|nr:SRPBCC family protein [Aquimarina atlantica]EZH72597.1 cell division protein [Aquimarina atlantica]
MTTIRLTTQIKSPVEEVFDLVRSIDFHMISVDNTKEKAIAGKTSGLIQLGETVTWRGQHFGIYLIHKSIITEYESPNNFTDEMVKGCFKSFKHQHIFYTTAFGTEMIDILEYKTPYGILGKLFDNLALKKHLTQFLNARNQSLKLYLESKNVVKSHHDNCL